MFKIDRTQYRLQPGRQSDYSAISTAHVLWAKAYWAMANRFERQLHESVRKALMNHSPHMKETQLEAIKALFITGKGHISVLPTGHAKSFTMFQAGFNGTAS